jgi:PKD repeat protein
MDSLGNKVSMDKKHKSYRFYWDFGNGKTSRNPNAKFKYSSVGNYLTTFIYADSTGKDSTIIQQTYVVLERPITQAVRDSLNGLKIVPNPTNGIFFVNLSNGAVPDNIEVYSVLGQQIYKMNQIQLSTLNSPLSIDLSSQPAGVYFIRVVAGNRVYTGKVVKN